MGQTRPAAAGRACIGQCDVAQPVLEALERGFLVTLSGACMVCIGGRLRPGPSLDGGKDWFECVGRLMWPTPEHAFCGSQKSYSDHADGQMLHIWASPVIELKACVTGLMLQLASCIAC